jgi:lysyl-tRNA synthetase class 2
VCAARSQRGELSISPLQVTLLTPCMRMLPKQHFGLKDQETRYRQRFLDLIINEDNRRIFVTRARVINYVRRYLNDRGFLEVRPRE